MNPASAFLEAVHDREHALVMGVLNVTPDSFSDGGVHEDAARAIAAGLGMAADHAAIVDVGGESTRPGAEPVEPAAEAERILPVVEGLRGQPVSIDTRRAPVARAASGWGDQWVVRWSRSTVSMESVAGCTPTRSSQMPST